MDIKRTITQLTDELGEERVLTRTAIGADYCHDEYPGGSYAPDAVIEARTTEEVSRVLKVCCETAFRHRSRRRHRSGGRLGRNKRRHRALGKGHERHPRL